MDYILGISVDELRDTLKQGRSMVLVDLDMEVMHEDISGAIILTIDRIKARAEENLKDEGAGIVVFAGSLGDRVAAAMELSEMGYTDVRYLTGDINLLIKMEREGETEARRIFAA